MSVVLLALGAAAQTKAGHTVGQPAAQQMSEPTAQAGTIFRPESGKENRPGYAHTTYSIRSVDGSKPAGYRVPMAMSAIPTGVISQAVTLTEEAETPQSLGCLYVKSPSSVGCIPNYNSGSHGPTAAGYGAIALVDAFDNPNAATDLQTFDNYWGLSAANFIKVVANGNGACTTPATNADWSLESSLDIEYAHVFAPNATIILVEACTNSLTDLFYAEQVAFNFILTNFPVGGQVSNSWGGNEFSGQIADDIFFADFNYSYVNGYKTPILAFVSAGDSGLGASYPSTNPWVISAGGTSILRNAATLKFSSESCWGRSGGGVSAFETYAALFSGGANMGAWANFQYPIFNKSNRVTPDLAFDADPSSGAWVYSQFGAGGWEPVGGTSLSSPALASIINRAGNKLGSVFLTPFTGNADWFTTGENNLLYSQLGAAKAYKSNFYDVKTGSNGSAAAVSYDECTGVGTPRGLLGK